MNSDTHSYAMPLRRFRVNQIVTCEATEITYETTAAFSPGSRYAVERDAHRNRCAVLSFGIVEL